jgi:mannose-1-phosphate guanylyltransferase
MSKTGHTGLVNGIPGQNYFTSLIGDYVKNLDLFFEEGVGAVREGTRDDGRPPFLFSEVTGYAIRDLLLLHSLTGDPSYFERAVAASDWLTETACDAGGWVRTRFYFERDADEERRLDSFAGGNIFSFDNGICLGGLVSLYEALRREAATRPELSEMEQRLAEKVRHLADNLVARVDEDGSIAAIFDARGAEVLVESPRWSQQRGSFHAKIAEALAELYALVRVEAYGEAARRICRFAISRQTEEGRFVTDAQGNTQLHAHCYSAEGLLRAGTILGEEEFVAAARRATEWALRQCRGGKLAQEVGDSVPGGMYCRTDALAQVLGLGSVLSQAGMLGEEYWETLGELAEGLWGMKHPVAGYFRYGFYEDGQESKTLSYWTNVFAFHCLMGYAAAWVCRNMAVVVLAGGTGSRCWPISCVDLPKPLCRGMLGDKSLLEETASRFLKAGCVRPENLYVLTTPDGLYKAQEQLRPLGVPAGNVVEEPEPKGTLGALHRAFDSVGDRLKPITVVSMADDLIEPLHAFRQALLKAALAAWWDGEGVIVSIGLPGRECDPRFGHAIYRRGQEVSRDVYMVERFVEKPPDPAHLRMAEGEAYAWDCGCIVSRRDYLGRIIEGLSGRAAAADGATLRGDITRQIMEKSEYRKGVALCLPNTRFLDAGVPGKDLREFFLGTGADRGDGNIFLGPKNVEVVFARASGNVIISDRMAVEVIGINDHLIIDNSHTNTAVVLPLDRVDALPVIYRMFKDVDGFHPYIVGGEVTRNAPPHNLAHDCRGQCNTDSTHGLSLAIYCTNVRVKRSAERLMVVDQSHTRLTMIAEMLARPVGLSRVAQQLLRLLCLSHDLCDFLSEDEAMTESELACKIKNLTDLDFTTLHPGLLRDPLYVVPETVLTTDQQELLTLFDDRLNSAVEA